MSEQKCPVCGYDPGRDAGRYPALCRIRAGERLFPARGVLLVGGQEWEELNRRLARMGELLVRLCGDGSGQPAEKPPEQKPPARKNPEKPSSGAPAAPSAEREEAGSWESIRASIRPAYPWFDAMPPRVTVPALTGGFPVRRIASDAFRCSSVREVSVSRGIREIGAFAFAECPFLEKVILPDSLTELGAGCFANSPNLSSLSLPACWRGRTEEIRRTGLTPSCAVQFRR